MTESPIEITTPTSIKKSSTRKFLLPVVIVIALVGGIGFFASKTGLDKALVKQAIDDIAANIKQNAQKSGRDMTLSYKDIEIKGGLSNRHAIVISPAITAKESGAVVVYRTSEIALFPASKDLQSVRIELAKPITLYDSEDAKAEPTLTITQKAAIIANMSPETIGDQAFVNTKIMLPEAFLIDGPKDKASDPWNVATLTLAPGGTITHSAAKGEGAALDLGKSEVSLKSIAITPDAKPADAITIEAIKSRYSNVLNDKKMNDIQLALTINKITSSKDNLPYGDVNVAVEASFEGALPKTPEAFAEANGQESAFKLKTFSINTPKAALYATADFVAGAKDVLPVGTANITVENLAFVLKELKANDMLDANTENMFGALVLQITGKNISETKDLSIDIKRVRDGAFQVGKTTFEEIMALVLKGAFGGAMPAAPVAPSSESSPIATPKVPAPTPTVEE